MSERLAPLPISVTILTKNSMLHIEKVLSSLSLFSEILVYDTGSSDETLSIASTFSNVLIREGPLQGFGPTHNLVSSLATHDWIFSLDSDEILSKKARETLVNLSLNPQNVYSFPRHNYYRNQWVRHSGWYPDRQIRLYNRTKTCFSEAHVHEGILAKGLHRVSLDAPLYHYSYGKISDFLEKMEHYSSLFAKEHAGKKDSSLCKAVLHGLFAFGKTFFLKRGFLDGKAGFEIALYNANTAFYKYLKLWEKNRELAAQCDDDRKKTAIDQEILGKTTDISSEEAAFPPSRKKAKG